MIYYEYDRFGMTEDYLIEEYGNLHYPYLHFHRNFELVYLISGSLKVTIDYSDVVLKGGQFILVFPNQIHSFESLGDAHAKVCIFSPMLVNSFYHALNNYVPKDHITNFSLTDGQIICNGLTKGANKYIVKGLLYLVIGEIFNQTTLISSENSKDIAVVHRSITYISQNFAEKISLSTLATALGYNYQYLSNQLTKCHINFNLMLNQFRVDYAKQLLLNGNMTITEIAFRCGYNNIRTFNRNFFKLMHVTPNAFRNQK